MACEPLRDCDVGHIPVDYPAKAAAIPKRHSMNCVCKICFSRCAGQIYGYGYSPSFCPASRGRCWTEKGRALGNRARPNHFNVQLLEGGASISRLWRPTRLCAFKRKPIFLSPADQNHTGPLGIVIGQRRNSG